MAPAIVNLANHDINTKHMSSAVMGNAIGHAQVPSLIHKLRQVYPSSLALRLRG
jgi:hypothetical protein